MATPPTRVLYATPSTGNYTSTTTPKTTTSFDVVAGDIIIVLAMAEDSSTIAAVTPSASGGSVTWTARAQFPAAVSGATGLTRCWTGVVGATATGITVSLARISAAADFWGFSATLVRNHGGVGQVFQGGITAGNGAPSVGAACSANSGVFCAVSDWNAVDGATRTWLTINGAAETETVYTRTAGRFAGYEGYRIDAGAAGTITQGLTVPSTMRWSLSGVEILGSAGASASPADNLGITDSTAQVTAFDRTQADPLGLTDSAQPVKAAERSAADPVGLADGLQIVIAQSHADSVGVTDTLQVSSGASVIPADSLGIADGLALARSINLADSIGATDTAGAVVGSAVTHDAPVGVTDNVTVALAMARTVGDQVGTTDAADADLTAPGSADLADPLGVIDLLAATAQILRTAADNLGITDAVTVELGRSPSDPVGIADSVTVQTGAGSTLADSVGIGDSAVAVLSRVVTLGDQVGVLDQVGTLNPATPPLPIDGVSLTANVEQRGLTLTGEARTLEVET